MAADGYGGAVRTVHPAGEGATPAVRPAGNGVLPTIGRVTILGTLATAALLGVVAATAGLGVAGWIAGLATGSAATALLVTARMRSARLGEKPIGEIAKDLGIAKSCCTGTAAAIANTVHHASASATCRSHSTSCHETPPAARQADRLWGTWQDVHQASTRMCGTPIIEGSQKRTFAILGDNG
jgi:hypothetical protein